MHELLVIVEGLFHNQTIFMHLGESFEKIFREHEIDHTNYDEAMSNMDANLVRSYEGKIRICVF